MQMAPGTLLPSEKQTVAIVIPMFNEGNRIAQTMAELAAWLPSVPWTVHLLLVDDGSSDNTVREAEVHGSAIENLRIIRLPHRGKAATVLDGLAAATGDIVGFMDADLATPFAAVTPAIETVIATNGVAIGSREGATASREGEPWLRHVMGRIFNLFVQFLLLPGIEDTQCGFKFFSRPSLDVILTHHRIYRDADKIISPRVTAFDLELLYIAKAHGFPITQIPVTWRYGEQSKVHPIADSVHNARDALRIRVNAWRGLYT